MFIMLVFKILNLLIPRTVVKLISLEPDVSIIRALFLITDSITSCTEMLNTQNWIFGRGMEILQDVSHFNRVRKLARVTVFNSYSTKPAPTTKFTYTLTCTQTNSHAWTRVSVRKFSLSLRFRSIAATTTTTDTTSTKV